MTQLPHVNGASPTAGVREGASNGSVRTRLAHAKDAYRQLGAGERERFLVWLLAGYLEDGAAGDQVEAVHAVVDRDAIDTDVWKRRDGEMAAAWLARLETVDEKELTPPGRYALRMRRDQAAAAAGMPAG